MAWEDYKVERPTKPKITPNTWPNGSKFQCEMHTPDGKFVGYGNVPTDAWADMWLQYEMWCDPDLHK